MDSSSRPEPPNEPGDAAESYRPPRSWGRKFGDALRGMRRGIRGESSFFVHFFIAACVLAAAVVFQPPAEQWCLLVLCTAGVLAAEMFNSCIERLAKLIDRNHNPELGEALDVASAAVLIAAIGAASVGLIIFGRLFLDFLWRLGG